MDERAAIALAASLPTLAYTPDRTSCAVNWKGASKWCDPTHGQWKLAIESGSYLRMKW